MYFVSSLLPIYALLCIFGFIAKIEQINWHLKELNSISLDYKITILILFILIIMSLLSLLCVIRKINNRKEITDPSNKSAFVTENYNQGFREFLVSTIIPLAFTFSFIDYPIASLLVLVIIQLTIFEYFQNASDILPNLSLTILGYTLFIAKDGNDKKLFLFGQTKRIDDLIDSEVGYITLEDTDSNIKNIGVIKRRSDNFQ